MNSVIYYPHIVPAPKWLKLAALCWESVYTLRPADGEDWSALAEIEPLDTALGSILRPLYPSEISRIPAVRDDFIRWIHARAGQREVGNPEPFEFPHYWWMYNSKVADPEIRQALEQAGWLTTHTDTYSERVPRWTSDQDSRRGIEWIEDPADPRGSRSKTARRYRELKAVAREAWASGDREEAVRLNAEAQAFLHKHMVTRQRSRSTLLLPKDVSLSYLSICAAWAGKQEHRDIAADSARFTDPVMHGYAGLRGEVASSLLEAYLPENLADVEPQRIRDFRQVYGPQRLKFQVAVQELVNKFTAVSSEGELDSVQEHIGALAREQVEAAKKAYRSAKVKIGLATFGITVTPPALLTLLASLLGIGAFPPEAVLAAIALFTARSYIALNEAKAARDASPWSYVVEAAQIR
jgi:hypothetical protein